ncbi:5'-3' exonuclease PLD3 [Aplochiton taeniatus]
MIGEDHNGGNLKEMKLIEDEEPPWKKDSREMEVVLGDEEEEGEEDGEDDLGYACKGTEPKACALGNVSALEAVDGNHDQQLPDWDSVLQKSSTAPESKDGNDAAPPPVPRRSTKPGKSTKTCCSSFTLFFLLPSALLLLGGFGQHIWHYGLPMSVSSLMAQLELHWLDGCGLALEPCSSDCRVRLVESIPQGLYPSGPTPLPSISEAWISLLDNANSSVHIAAFYFSLRASDTGLAELSDSQGKEVFKHLMQLQPKGVKLQIAVNAPQSSAQDTADLAATGAEVREVDLQSVTGGIIHTKLWVVDQKHLYLGSANMDWRSLTQVKEVGVSIEDCSCLAQDASRIFGVYWNIGSQKNGSLPPYWPARFSALSSAEYPLSLKLNGVAARVYLSSAPPQISARGRSDDLTTILSVISDAQKFVYISVMDYLPLSQYSQPQRFWPAIDTAIRAAACTRGVKVNLLVSCWPHSPGAMFVFLQSLTTLHKPPLGCSIHVKVFKVPSTTEQEKIPFARVNHAKYMVTDRVVYIGTSNWSENYFTQTAGVGLVVNQTGSVIGQGQKTLQSQLEQVFQRDWTSDYARILSNDDVEHCKGHQH